VSPPVEIFLLEIFLLGRWTDFARKSPEFKVLRAGKEVEHILRPALCFVKESESPSYAPRRKKRPSHPGPFSILPVQLRISVSAACDDKPPRENVQE